MSRLPALALGLLLLAGCNNIPPTGPTVVTTTTVVTTNTNFPPGGSGPTTPTPGTGSGGAGTGTVQTLPTYGATVLRSYADSPAGIAALAASCPTSSLNSWAFLDGLVDQLRVRDARWGYACKRGNCADVSADIVSYHASDGPNISGATGVINVDVIQDLCGSNPVAQWLPYPYDATALWTTRGRF